jgi:hypothetical protein
MEILEILDGSIDGAVAILLFRELAESAARHLAPRSRWADLCRHCFLNGRRKRPNNKYWMGSWVLPGIKQVS